MYIAKSVDYAMSRGGEMGGLTFQSIWRISLHPVTAEFVCRVERKQILF